MFHIPIPERRPKRRHAAAGGVLITAAVALAQCGPTYQDRHLPSGDVQYALQISGATVQYHDGDNDGHYYPYAYWSRARTSQDVQNCLAYARGAYPASVDAYLSIFVKACGSGSIVGVGWAVPASGTHTMVQV